jgi:DNA-directed RNA polymerase specialized sigma subunit
MTEQSPNTQPSSGVLEQVAAQVETGISLLPLDDVRLAHEHLVSAAAALESVASASGNTALLQTIEMVGATAQTTARTQGRLVNAADKLNEYLFETGIPSTATRQIMDRIGPLRQAGRTGRYLEELQELHDNDLTLLMRQSVPGADEVLIKRYENALWAGAKTIGAGRILHGIDEADLWVAGVSEFIRSCRNFRPGKAWLSQYALQNAFFAMRAEATVAAQPVRLPTGLQHDVIYRIRTENTRRLHAQMPLMTDKEIAKMFKIPLNTDGRTGGRRSVADIRRAIALAFGIGSLDTGFSAGTSDTEYDASFDNHITLKPVSGQTPEDPADIVVQNELRNLLDAVMDVLNDREQQFMRLRFGLDDGQTRSAAEVSTKMGISLGTGQYIEGLAFSKMRNPQSSQLLREHRTTGENDRTAGEYGDQYGHLF